MPSSTITDSRTRLLHFLDLDDYGLAAVPSERKGEAKREVADFLQNEILRFLDRGTSPVKGEGRFKRLSDKYSKKEKGGIRTSNLELEGDLKDSLQVQPGAGSFLRIGHTGSQVEKADGHNQISDRAQRWARAFGDEPFPRRRYIPDTGQEFVEGITSELRKIIGDFVPEEVTRAERPEVDVTVGTVTSSTAVPLPDTLERTTIGIDNLFSDDIIGDLLLDALERR